MTVPANAPTPPAKKTTAKRTPAKRATSRPSTSDASTKSENAPTPRLPKVGSMVTYDAIDPLTAEQMQGTGFVVDAYTHGSGKDRISRVLLARLPADLNLSADDVKAVPST